MLPAVIFLVGHGAVLLQGTAWGTFGVLIPIVVKICSGDNRKYLEVSLASCLCGSVFGDNTSPISDTTILASSSTQCSFLVHVATQLPYAITTAVVSIIGYLIAGWTQSVFVTLLVSILLLLAVLATIRMTRKKHAEPVVEVELPEVKKDGDEEKTEKTEENEVDEVVIGEAPPVEVSMDVQPSSA